MQFGKVWVKREKEVTEEVINWAGFFRPPGTTVPDGLTFHRRCFFFRQPNLRGPSADRHETLPHDRNLVAIAG